MLPPAMFEEAQELILSGRASLVERVPGQPWQSTCGEWLLVRLYVLFGLYGRGGFAGMELGEGR